jgi:hypothetical protein
MVAPIAHATLRLKSVWWCDNKLDGFQFSTAFREQKQVQELVMHASYSYNMEYIPDYLFPELCTLSAPTEWCLHFLPHQNMTSVSWVVRTQDYQLNDRDIDQIAKGLGHIGDLKLLTVENQAAVKLAQLAPFLSTIQSLLLDVFTVSTTIYTLHSLLTWPVGQRRVSSTTASNAPTSANPPTYT